MIGVACRKWYFCSNGRADGWGVVNEGHDSLLFRNITIPSIVYHNLNVTTALRLTAPTPHVRWSYEINASFNTESLFP